MLVSICTLLNHYRLSIKYQRGNSEHSKIKITSSIINEWYLVTRLPTNGRCHIGRCMVREKYLVCMRRLPKDILSIDCQKGMCGY